MNAKYRCLKCSHKWEGDPDVAFQGCPMCGNLYIKWTNFEHWRKHHAGKKKS